MNKYNGTPMASETRKKREKKRKLVHECIDLTTASTTVSHPLTHGNGHACDYHIHVVVCFATYHTEIFVQHFVLQSRNFTASKYRETFVRNGGKQQHDKQQKDFVALRGLGQSTVGVFHPNRCQSLPSKDCNCKMFKLAKMSRAGVPQPSDPG